MAALSSLAPLSLSVLPRSKSLMRPLDASVIGRDVAGVRRSGSGRGNGRGGDALASEPREDGERTRPTEPRGRGALDIARGLFGGVAADLQGAWSRCCGLFGGVAADWLLMPLFGRGAADCLVEVLRIVCCCRCLVEVLLLAAAIVRCCRCCCCFCCCRCCWWCRCFMLLLLPLLVLLLPLVLLLLPLLLLFDWAADCLIFVLLFLFVRLLLSLTPSSD